LGQGARVRQVSAQAAVDEASNLVKQTEAALAKVKTQAEAAFLPWLIEQVARTVDGFRPWTTITPARLATTEGYQLSATPDGTIVSSPADFPQDDFVITVSAVERSRI